MKYCLIEIPCADHDFMHVPGAPLVSCSRFQCVGCGTELSRINVTLPLEKGYSVPYHREYGFIQPMLVVTIQILN